MDACSAWAQWHGGGSRDGRAGGSDRISTPEGTGDFATIQAAIDAAEDGDVIELTDGIFTGDGNREIDLLGKAITLRSQGGQPESMGGGACPTFVDCAFIGNWAVGEAAYGGALYCWDICYPELDNCIIAFGLGGGAAATQDSCAPVLRCCDIHGNAGGDWVDCIADQYGVDGNFSANPLFCDAGSGDLSLHADSPFRRRGRGSVRLRRDVACPESVHVCDSRHLLTGRGH